MPSTPRLRPRKTVPKSMAITVKGATGFATVRQVRKGKKVEGLRLPESSSEGFIKVWSQDQVGGPARVGPVLVISNLPPDHPLLKAPVDENGLVQ